MVALAIVLKRALVSLPLALAASALKRARRSLARVIRLVCACLASCRITTSRSASAMFFHPLRNSHQIDARDYADQGPPWQFPPLRHPHLPVYKIKGPRWSRGPGRALAQERSLAYFSEATGPLEAACGSGSKPKTPTRYL